MLIHAAIPYEAHENSCPMRSMGPQPTGQFAAPSSSSCCSHAWHAHMCKQGGTTWSLGASMHTTHSASSAPAMRCSGDYPSASFAYMFVPTAPSQLHPSCCLERGAAASLQGHPSPPC
jgi:hypothetical protein